MRRLVAILLIITALLISGCQTISGLGRDLEQAGEWIQEKSN